MRTFYKIYPWLAVAALLVIGFTVVQVGIILLIIVAVTLIFFNVRVSIEPRWGRSKAAQTLPAPPLNKKQVENNLKRMRRKMTKGEKDGC